MTVTCADDRLNCIHTTKQNNTLFGQSVVIIVGMEQMLRLLMSNEKRCEQMDLKQRMSHDANNCMSILRYANFCSEFKIFLSIQFTFSHAQDDHNKILAICFETRKVTEATTR